MTMKKISRRGMVLSGLALMASGCMPSRREVKAAGHKLPSHLILACSGSASHTNRSRRPDRLSSIPRNATSTMSRVTAGRLAMAWPSARRACQSRAGRQLAARRNGRHGPLRPSMIKRKPWLEQYAGGVPGGPNNPLGARALYLYQNGHDTKYRLHGTNEPWTIGTAVSNGCIRLTNEDVVELYDRTPEGATVIVI